MKAQLPRPEHRSYLLHRKQRNTQIILPMALSVALMMAVIALISLATFNAGGDVARWAAISTIWMVIPMLVVGLIALAALCALVYGMAWLLNALPHYTNAAQHYIHIAQSYIMRAADTISRSVISIDSAITNIKVFFQRIIP